MTTTEAVTYCVVQFLAMLLCMEIGFRVGRRAGQTVGQRAQRVIETATLALLGLLLGFAFAGAMDRFNDRRNLTVREAAAISTAYHRIDVAPEAYEPELRGLFHQYLEARVRSLDSPETGRGVEPAMRETLRLQRLIWSKAVEASRHDPTGDTALLMLPAVNDLFEVTMQRAATLRVQTPLLILALLFTIASFTSLRAGYAMGSSGRRSPLHGIHFAAAVCMTVYVVLDLDNPRRGLIRQGAAEEILEHLQREI